MTLLNVRAILTCDGCGKRMVVDLDPADERPRDWAWIDLVIDTVRGGNALVEPDGLSSVQGESDQCLCPTCTKVVDSFVTDDRNATDEEISEALERQS